MDLSPRNVNFNCLLNIMTQVKVILPDFIIFYYFMNNSCIQYIKKLPKYLKVKFSYTVHTVVKTRGICNNE